MQESIIAGFREFGATPDYLALCHRNLDFKM